jgi:hypothetical protein
MDDISVVITHNLYLGVALRTIEGLVKQGEVLVVRQNGSEMTVYGLDFVRAIPAHKQANIVRSPRTSNRLSMQLDMIAMYLWILSNKFGEKDAISGQAWNVIRAAITMNSDSRGRGFPENEPVRGKG